MFQVTTRRKDDSVEVRADKDKTLFIIQSPFGISQAVIERKDEKWPGAVVLRLCLKGLESFRASNGKVTLDAAVPPSATRFPRRVALFFSDPLEDPYSGPVRSTGESQGTPEGGRRR